MGALWRHLRKMFFSSKKTEQCAGNLFPSTWGRHLCVDADAWSCGSHPAHREKPLETQRNHPRDWCCWAAKFVPAHKLATSRFLMCDLLSNSKLFKLKKNLPLGSISAPVWRKWSIKEFRTLFFYRPLSYLWPCIIASCISASHPPPPSGLRLELLTYEIRFLLAGC